MRDHSGNSLRPGAFLWGKRRVEAGLSIKQLEAATGIFRGFLSRMENGVMIPSAEEYEKVEAAIAEAMSRRSGGAATITSLSIRIAEHPDL